MKMMGTSGRAARMRRLLEERPEDAELLVQVGDLHWGTGGHEMAKAALEMAVWELAARREDVPLYQLLGGRGGEIAAGVSVGLQAEDTAVVEQVAAEVAAGYRRIKLKIKPGWDIEPLRAVREAFPTLRVGVDAKQ